jgi:hypothetical protein
MSSGRAVGIKDSKNLAKRTGIEAISAIFGAIWGQVLGVVYNTNRATRVRKSTNEREPPP